MSHMLQNRAYRQSEVLASKSKVVATEWTFRETGAEIMYTAIVKESIGFCGLKCVLKSFAGQNEL